MTTYDGVSLRYDPMGNPLTYYNGTRWNMVWENGRQLKAAMTGGKKLSFTYKDEGIRTSKTVNGVVHTYRLNGSQIIAEEWTTADDDGTTVEHMILFLYDAEGTPVGMQYRNQTYAPEIFDVYWFEKNLQGDIVAVYDEDGTKLISYTYDAWGNFTTTYHNGCTASHNANLNPFRYRGYYYDSELEMYYLKSRYYDAVIGRFINADTYVSTGQGILGNNMFAYCNNNPIYNVDPSGHCLECWWERQLERVKPAFNFVATVLTNAWETATDEFEYILKSGDSLGGIVEYIQDSRIDYTVDVVRDGLNAAYDLWVDPLVSTINGLVDGTYWKSFDGILLKGLLEGMADNIIPTFIACVAFPILGEEPLTISIALIDGIWDGFKIGLSNVCHK